MDGILVIDKAEGLTSFDVVAKVRRLLREKKCGHTGTLDPMATGVLPVLLGSATKLSPYLMDTKKEYLATMVLGQSTDTLDRTGQVTEEADLSGHRISREQVVAALADLTGDILQEPPMYSALKKDGVRLYDLARQGVTLELEKRPVTIYELELTDYSFPSISFRAVTSKGTYVRSLVRDLARALGVPGTMTALRRTLTGGFPIEAAHRLDELEALDREGIIGRIIQVEQPLLHYPEHQLAQEYLRLLTNGVRLKDPGATAGLTEGLYRIKSTEGELIGLAEYKDRELVLSWRA
ncbi:tRNA pseudouridine(55) synthase TruB [Proteiniclasticum sp. QWL-01]|uniref:tRNA pseudouridine(55) synthase TruB n=1 Tax=Proteiniclasticum sp. QWL-01 TaxID=3036945 RepID=UPI002411165C|nr:tRNA pseudouridine(55) synthase TruB [Proteiniclasticum sp. QWL-01]WFF74300.1 tRNA pseudouridine(55) synthase TruB [Proteiniclasticum sp. QWL-01]